MNYVVITENDESIWKDKTGEQYHFPKKYLKLLSPGNLAIYYKSKLTNKAFREKRLTDQPHYFGYGRLGEIVKDSLSKKNDYFIQILDFKQFFKPVLAKVQGRFLEDIPANRKTNYWRDGARVITKEIFDKIIQFAGFNAKNNLSIYNDNEKTERAFESEFLEGDKKYFYGTRYERDEAARQQAIEIHGLSCIACGFNFGNFYGEWGEGFIHVHHTKPISKFENRQKVDPEKDLAVLCPNCHSMIHRKKNRVLSLSELRLIIANNRV